MTAADPARSVVNSIEGERAMALLKSVRDHELPPEVESLVAEYQTFEGARPWFIWRWVHRLAPKNTMPVVEDEHRETVATNKTILVLFITILDDLMEKDGDRATFDSITRFIHLGGDHRTDGGEGTYGNGRLRSYDMVRGGAGGNVEDSVVDEEYVEFAKTVWDALDARLQQSPFCERYAPLFCFDVQQIVGSIEYSSLVIDRPDLATATDLRRYEAHNMGMYSYLDIDLMYAQTDHTDDLSQLRAFIEPAQQMARIGNWLSTWERELREGDVSSAITVAAAERDLIDLCELRSARRAGGGDPAEIEQAIDRIRDSGIEAEFLAEWNDNYSELHRLSDEIDVVDLDPFVEGTKDVLRYHLASRGYK